jgi:hypothetical protein
VRIARVEKENVEPKRAAAAEGMGEAGRSSRMTDVMSYPYSDTYAIVNNNGDAITAEEIKSQTNMQIPPTLEQFIFEGYSDRIEKIIDGLSLTHNIFNFRLLPPIIRSFKIICFRLRTL